MGRGFMFPAESSRIAADQNIFQASPSKNYPHSSKTCSYWGQSWKQDQTASYLEDSRELKQECLVMKSCDCREGATACLENIALVYTITVITIDSSDSFSAISPSEMLRFHLPPALTFATSAYKLTQSLSQVALFSSKILLLFSGLIWIRPERGKGQSTCSRRPPRGQSLLTPS